MQARVRIFVSYAHEDEERLRELETHLASLRRREWIEMWWDGQIQPGGEWSRHIDDRLERAEIVLLLVSADYLNSEFCGREVNRALERHRKREAVVIPVIVRPVDWHGEHFAALQVLPREGRPVTDWSDRDKAWTSVAEAITRLVEKLRREHAGQAAGSEPSPPNPAEPRRRTPYLLLTGILVLAVSIGGLTLFSTSQHRSDRPMSTSTRPASAPVSAAAVHPIYPQPTTPETGTQDSLRSSDVPRPPSTDLIVSPLNTQERLQPLEGYKVLDVRNQPVYTGGCKVSFTLSHSGKGRETVNVNNITLHVARFLAGVQPQYVYDADPDQVYGRGSRRPNTFIVALDGFQISQASWTGTDGATKKVHAGNLLPIVLDLTMNPGDDMQDVRGTVLLNKPGYYEVFFSFAYTVAGVDRQQRSALIRLYRV